MFLLYAILTYVVWAYIHEYTHLLIAKKLVGVNSYTIKLYPHNHSVLGFVFASVSYQLKRNITSTERAKISFAPRIPDLFALILFPFTSNLDLFWIILIGGGLIDTIRGSFVFSPTSDIKKYCEAWELKISHVRTIQLSLVGLSLILFILFRVY